MIVVENDYERNFQFGSGNIWTPVSTILGKIFSSAAAKTAKESVKQVAKKAAQNIGKAALKQTGDKAVKVAKEKFSKLLTSKKGKNMKSQLQQILQEDPSKGTGPSIGNTLTEGLGVKVA